MECVVSYSWSKWLKVNIDPRSYQVTQKEKDQDATATAL